MKKNELIQNSIVLSGQCDTLMRFKTESAFMSFQDVASLHATFLGIDDYSLLEKEVGKEIANNIFFKNANTFFNKYL